MTMHKAAVLAAAAILLAGLWPALAEAQSRHRHHRHHNHHHHGARLAIFAAPLLFLPRYVHPAPAYYAPSAPPVYIEQPQAPAYWYYCQSAGAYYPQVQSCPEGWQRVLPR